MVEISSESKQAFQVAEKFLIEQTTDKTGFLVVACKSTQRCYIHDQEAPVFFPTEAQACKFIQHHAGANAPMFLVD